MLNKLDNVVAFHSCTMGNKLGLKLLHERDKLGSFWWPYISNLPQAYTLPMFFPGEDIKNLQYAPILHQVNKRCQLLLDFEQQDKHALLRLTPDKHLFGGQEVDDSSLGWAIIVQEQETGSTIMMVKVVVEKVINEDDHLLLCYGCLNNDIFLLDYRFVIQSNPYDCIELIYDGALLEAANTTTGVSSPNFSTHAPDLKVSLYGEEINEGRLLAAL